MANERPRRIKIDPFSLGQWCLERITNNWQPILAITGSAGLTALGTIQEWVRPWNSFEWACFFVAVFASLWLLFSIGTAVRAWAYSKRAQAKFADHKVSTAVVNVLAPTHDHQRINLIDFYHPFFQFTENVRFSNCEFFGPSAVFMNDCRLDGIVFADCEIVIVANNINMKGVVAFKNCQFLQSKMYRVTLFMSRGNYDELPNEMKRGVTLLTP